MNQISRAMRIVVFAITAVGFCCNGARAHSDDYFDANPSPHGGQVRMSGAYHFELIISDTAILVYVTDHANQPIATKGATAKLQITIGSNTIRADLTPAEGNMLSADWSGAVAADLTAKLSVKFPNEKVYTAKFTPFAKSRR